MAYYTDDMLRKPLFRGLSNVFCDLKRLAVCQFYFSCHSEVETLIFQDTWMIGKTINHFFVHCLFSVGNDSEVQLRNVIYNIALCNENITADRDPFKV